MSAQLKRVTITGAADSCEIMDLLAISHEFPFVEWGLLCDGMLHPGGDGRWPSLGWLNAFAYERHCRDLKLSLHLCGGALAEFSRGMVTSLQSEVELRAFDRLQLNWHGRDVDHPELADDISFAIRRLKISINHEPEIVFQLDGMNDTLGARVMRLGGLVKHRVSGLFDRSHGEGVCPADWPSLEDHEPVLGWYGWAGGLGPYNIATELPRIAAAADGRDFWIDMETKVLGVNDCLDLDRVRRVLEQVVESGFLEVGQVA